MMIAGIDPGLKGSVCFLSTDGTLVVHDMPVLRLLRGGKKRGEVDPHALAGLFWKEHAGHAFVEQGWSRPHDSGPGGFAAGKSYGVVIGVLAAVDIPYTIISPQKWKRALGVPAAKDGARARASELLPAYADQWRLVKQDGRAEASLIALFGIQSLNGIAREAA
jgi:hypothetical protein